MGFSEDDQSGLLITLDQCAVKGCNRVFIEHGAIGGDCALQRYSQVFEKEGYVTLEKTVQVTQAPTDNPANDVVTLGDITLESTLSLSSDVVKRYTTPGNKL